MRIVFACLVLTMAFVAPLSTLSAQVCEPGTLARTPIRFEIAPIRDDDAFNGIETLGTFKAERFAINGGVSSNEIATLYRLSGEWNFWNPEIRDRTLHVTGKAEGIYFDPGGSFRFVDARGCLFKADEDLSIRFALGLDNFFAEDGITGDRNKLMIGLSCLAAKMDDNPFRGSCHEFEPNTWFVEGLISRDLEDSQVYLQGAGYFEDPIWHDLDKDEFDPRFEHFRGEDGEVLALDGLGLVSPFTFDGGRTRIRPQVGGGVGFFHQNDLNSSDDLNFWILHADLWLSALPIFDEDLIPTDIHVPGYKVLGELVQDDVLAITLGVRYSHLFDGDTDDRLSSSVPIFLPSGAQTFLDGRRFFNDSDDFWTLLIFATYYTR